MAKKTKKGASRAKTAARRGSSPKRSAKVDGRTVRKMKCPEPGCRRKSRGPRYNYYCDLHEGKSEAAKEKGLLRRRAEDDKEPAAVTALSQVLAQDLTSRCVFVTAIMKLGRCARDIHDGDDHLYTAPQWIPPAARTNGERAELGEEPIDPSTEPPSVPAPQEGEAPPVTTTAPQIDPPTGGEVPTGSWPTPRVTEPPRTNLDSDAPPIDAPTPAAAAAAPDAPANIMNEI